MQSLAKKLEDCKQQIETACAIKDIDMGTVRKCRKTIRMFRTRVKKCMRKNGCEACQCWRDQKLKDSISFIKSCSLSVESKLTAEASRYCRGNFSLCRKHEDKSISAVAACGKSAESMLLTAKRLKYNFAILGNTLDRTRKLLNRDSDTFQKSSESCKDMMTSNEAMLNYIIDNPLSILDVEESEDEEERLVPSRCSQEDKLNLGFQIKLLDSATKIIFNTLTKIQEKLKKKYFFDSILDFMKFLTDEESVDT